MAGWWPFLIPILVVVAFSIVLKQEETQRPLYGGLVCLLFGVVAYIASSHIIGNHGDDFVTSWFDLEGARRAVNLARIT